MWKKKYINENMNKRIKTYKDECKMLTEIQKTRSRLQDDDAEKD